MILRGRLLTIDGATPVPNGTPGDIRKLSDNSLIATVTTTDGFFEHTMNGNPGPYKVVWTYAGATREMYSSVVGVSGPMDIANIPLFFQLLQDGVVDNAGNELAVSASGANMQVTVATGAALVRGIVYDRNVSGTVTVTAAHATLPRTDTVVVRVVPPGAGSTIEGRSEVAVVVGTAAASPVAPTLSQTTTLWEYPLANIAVGAAVSVIGSDKITDRRTFATVPLTAGSVTATHLATNSVGTDEIAANAVGTTELIDASVTQPKLASKVGANTVVDNNTTIINDTGVVIDFLRPLVVTDRGGTGVYVDVAANSITTEHLAEDYSLPRPTLMPGTEYVATGSLSTGTRTLATLNVGPLVSGVTYDIQVQHFCTLRGTGTTGTVNLQANINGGVQRAHEYQYVGTDPRLGVATQTAFITGTGVTIPVTASVVYVAGGACDVRAGEFTVIAIPR